MTTMSNASTTLAPSVSAITAGEEMGGGQDRPFNIVMASVVCGIFVFLLAALYACRRHGYRRGSAQRTRLRAKKGTEVLDVFSTVLNGANTLGAQPQPVVVDTMASPAARQTARIWLDQQEECSYSDDDLPVDLPQDANLPLPSNMIMVDANLPRNMIKM